MDRGKRRERVKWSLKLRVDGRMEGVTNFSIFLSLSLFSTFPPFPGLSLHLSLSPPVIRFLVAFSVLPSLFFSPLSLHLHYFPPLSPVFPPPLSSTFPVIVGG